MSDTQRGILKVTKNGSGRLHNPAAPKDEIFVPSKLISTHNLVAGATIKGPVKTGKKGPRLTEIESVCGLKPAAFRKRTPFRRLTAIDPNERFNLAVSGEMSMRIIDLIAPIGKGTRGLIVAPPKAGKTMLLEQMARAIQTDAPETRLIMLLLDERPEEVTHFRRSLTEAEVFASSSDQPVRAHTELSELMLAHIRTELECGRDVVVLVDSLTRLVRAFNLKGSRGRSRTMSGGVEAGALQIPRRLFGAARNIEHGGSVTIIATVLVDTGSRMDDFIFEEFKGTGNSEIVLDRSLAEAYIFPAIDLTASGTRKEEQLHDDEDNPHVVTLRRTLADRPSKEAMLYMLDLLAKYPTNEALLQNLG